MSAGFSRDVQDVIVSLTKEPSVELFVTAGWKCKNTWQALASEQLKRAS